MRDFVSSLHQSTVRDYLARMVDDKVYCMERAKLYDFDYWDGDRRFGYGGYRYIPGRWTPVAEAIIAQYGLSNFSRLLDVGCGKGYLLYEIKKLLPIQPNQPLEPYRHVRDATTVRRRQPRR